MQYALMKVAEDKMVLIDANELGVIYDVLENQDKIIKDVRPAADEVTLQLVYGCFMPQPSLSPKEVIEKAQEAEGLELGFLYEEECRLIELRAIRLYEDAGTTLNYLPFAALIRSNLKIPKLKERAITAFLRNFVLKPEDNILNRNGIFSIKDQERRAKEITEENWMHFIDVERAIRAGNTLK